jgi:hypothetical protein
MHIILATQEQRLGGVQFKASLGKNFPRPHLNQQLGMVICLCNFNYMGNVNRRMLVKGAGHKQNLI